MVFAERSAHNGNSKDDGQHVHQKMNATGRYPTMCSTELGQWVLEGSSKAFGKDESTTVTNHTDTTRKYCCIW